MWQECYLLYKSDLSMIERWTTKGPVKLHREITGKVLKIIENEI